MMFDEQPDYDTVPGYRTTTFHADLMAGRMPVSRELLDDPRMSRYRREITDRAATQAMMHVERAVWKATYPTGMQTCRVEVTVPYSTSVVVPHPRSWWDRLLRRPVRYHEVPVGGTVTAEAFVRVDVEAEFRYPDANEHLGPAVPTGQATAHPGPARVVAVSTAPEFGPQGVESRRLLRCPLDGGGCGHHLDAHVPADVIEHGGCTIGDCDCRRYFIDNSRAIEPIAWQPTIGPPPRSCTARLDHVHGVTCCGESGPHDEHRGLCSLCFEEDPRNAWLTWRGEGLIHPGGI